MERKIALCLHGYFGTLSTNDLKSAFYGYKHLEKTILKNNQVDIFFHNWQPELEKHILSLYKAKKHICEPQIDFQNICIQNEISQDYCDQGFNRQSTIYLNAKFDRILSFYYSRKRSIDLALQTDNYDWLITSRFDISQRGGSEVNQIKFDKSLDNNYLYTTYWNQMNVGYGDMWFFSNSTIMSKYSKIYDSALHDFKQNSDYEKQLTSGWFDSNFYKIDDFNDPAQFTNEILKPFDQRSKNLMKFPKWRMPDSHLHHKWFAKKSGLYEITRWL